MLRQRSAAPVLWFQDRVRRLLSTPKTRRFFLAVLGSLFVCIPLPAVAQQEVEAELTSASALSERADYQNAIRVLQHVLRQAPRSYAANLLLGEDLVKSGRFKDAILPLEAASQVRPEDGVSDVYLAKASAALEDYPRASAALLTALNRSGASAPFLESWAAYCLDRVQTIGPHLRNTKEGEAVTLRIESAFRPEGTEVREGLLEQSAAEDPRQPGIWGELGVAQLELGQRLRAMESLKNAQQREPDANDTLQLEGLLAAAAGDWPAAENRLTALAAQSPAEFHNALGVWLHVLAPRQKSGAPGWPCLSDPAHACPATLLRPQGGDGMDARALYLQGRWEQLAELPPSASDGSLQKLWRGVAFAEMGKCPDAIPLLEYGMKVNEQVAGFWLDICYANEGNAALGRLRKDGDKVAVEQLEGDIQLHLHDDAAAAQTHYSEALKADPRNAHLLERSADAALHLGNRDDSRRLARAALAIDPRSASAIRTLASLAMQERDYTEALVQLKQLISIEPNDAWTRVQLGVAYGQLGHAQESLRYLGPQLAAGYLDAKGSLHAMLANALRKLGRDDEARKAAAEAEKLANSSLEGGSLQGSSDVHR